MVSLPARQPPSDEGEMEATMLEIAKRGLRELAEIRRERPLTNTGIEAEQGCLDVLRIANE